MHAISPDLKSQEKRGFSACVLLMWTARCFLLLNILSQTFFCFNDIFGIGRPGHSLHVIFKDKQNNVDGVDELDSDGGILRPGARPGWLTVYGRLGVL